MSQWDRSSMRDQRAYQTNLEALVRTRTEQLRSAILDLERSYDITLEVLADALGLRDAEAKLRSQRTCVFAKAIASAMGVPKDEMGVIMRGAFLHDIGMLGVPESILNKPTALEPYEYARMKEHCYLGYKLVQKIPFLHEAAEIVYAHHERFNGTGYPRGLRGDEIPLGARICAVADSFDAIMSHRQYRAARTFEAARKDIRAGSGKQFDPRVVTAFLGIPEHVWRDLRREIEARSNPTQADRKRSR